jgi:hypothetical protein
VSAAACAPTKQPLSAGGALLSLSLLHHHHHHLVRSSRRRLLLLLSLSSLLFSIFAFHLGEQVNEDAGLSRGEFQPADLHALATESEREIAFKP